jgi:hypothetical protein
MNLDGLPLDLPDLDTLTDTGAEFQSGPIRDQLGIDNAVFCHRERARKVDTFDLSKVRRAAAALRTMPGPGEYVHLIVGQEFCGFDLLPAFLELTKARRFDNLYLTTLGFSRDNLAQLGALLDAGRIQPRKLRILCGDFFRRADSALWDIGRLLAKERGFVFRSFRNHTKLILAELAGRFFVVESSANLRSCQNLEAFTLTQSKRLFQFHAGWIERVLKVSHD